MSGNSHKIFSIEFHASMVDYSVLKQINCSDMVWTQTEQSNMVIVTGLVYKGNALIRFDRAIFI